MRKLIIIACLLITLVSVVVPVNAKPGDVQIYYAGPEGSVKTALELAEFSITAELGEADVLVLNSQVPNLDAVRDRVQSGA